MTWSPLADDRSRASLRAVLGIGTMFALLLSSAQSSAPASAQTPEATCPPFTDITIIQEQPGSGSLAVQMQPPVALGPADAPDSQSFRLYYFIDRVAGLYPPGQSPQLLLGGDVLPDGNAQVVQRLMHSDVQTINLQLPAGSHSVAAVLAVGDRTCHETRPQPDPCSYVCGPPRTLLIGAAQVDIGPPQATATAPSASKVSGGATDRGVVGGMVIGTIAALAVGASLLRGSIRRH